MTSRGTNPPKPFGLSPAEAAAWELTFEDDFDVPTLDDAKWHAGYRRGQFEYYQRVGARHPAAYTSPECLYEISGGTLRLRVDETRPPRPHVGSSCVSCVATSDHRYGRDRTEATVFKKFGQKYGAPWRLDGRVVREYRGPTPQREMFVLLALFHYRFLPDHVESELTYPVEFAVDYVRVFRRTP